MINNTLGLLHLRAPKVAGLAKETVIAVCAAVVVAWYATKLDVDALLRSDQVSATASLMLFYSLVVLVPASLAVFRGWTWLGDPLKAASAALAGGASGLVAGGISIALSGSQCPINGLGGDAGRLAIWAQRPGSAPDHYPPLPYLIVRSFSGWLDVPEPHVLRDFSTVLLMLTGPLLYLGWRSMYGPVASLVLGPVLSMVYVDPYKPYSSLMLGISMVAVVALAGLLKTGELTWGWAVALGGVFALTTLMYPGWLTWMAPGVAVFLIFNLEWRNRWRDYIRFALIMIATWLVLTIPWLVTALSSYSGMRDTYQHFDTWMRPSFFAFWQSDTPLFGVRLPQFGEFGYLDTYSLLILGLLAVSLLVAGRSELVRLSMAIFALTYLRKLQLAADMRETGLVQLFPRANHVLIFAALIAIVVGLSVVLSHLTSETRGPLAMPLGPIAVLALGFLLSIQANAAFDVYMPSGDGKGALSLRAHTDGCWPIPTDADPKVPDAE